MPLSDTAKHKKKQLKIARRKNRLEKIESKRKIFTIIKQATKKHISSGFSRHAWNNINRTKNPTPVLEKKIGFDKQAWNNGKS